MAITKATKLDNNDDNNSNIKALMEYSIPQKDGSYYTANRKLPLFQNPEYPDKDVDALIALVHEKGGAVTMDLKVTITLYKPRKEPSINDWIIE